VVGPPEVSQVPLCPNFDIKIQKDFSGIFRETLFSKIFQNFDNKLKSQKNEDSMIASKSKPIMQ
jgi:hypothetical protein